jgi:hypothetical protein
MPSEDRASEPAVKLPSIHEMFSDHEGTLRRFQISKAFHLMFIIIAFPPNSGHYAGSSQGYQPPISVRIFML